MEGCCGSVLPSEESGSHSIGGGCLLSSLHMPFMDSHCHLTPMSDVLAWKAEIEKMVGKEQKRRESEAHFAKISEGSACRCLAQANNLLERVSNKGASIPRTTVEMEAPALEGTGKAFSENDGMAAESRLPEYARGGSAKEGSVVLCGTNPMTDWDTIDAVLSMISSQPSCRSCVSEMIPLSEPDGIEGRPVECKAPTESFVKPFTGTTHARVNTAASPPRDGLMSYATLPCRVYGGFGIHPWYVAPQLQDNHASLVDLESYLRRHPKAIVGEIGLDALRGPPLEEVQVPIFIAQLRMAAKFNRPVSVHCVRAYPVLQRILGGAVGGGKGSQKTITAGTDQSTANDPSSTEVLASVITACSNNIPNLCDVNCEKREKKVFSTFLFQALSCPTLAAEDLPPAIIVHGFSGSVEIAKALLRLKPLPYRKHEETAQAMTADPFGSTNAVSLETISSGPCMGQGSPCHALLPYPFSSCVEAPKKVSCHHSSPALSSAAQTSTPPLIRKKKPPTLSASNRLFFGIGAATTLRLKASTTSILLPMLIATRRVLVESDMFYTLRCNTISSEGSEMNSTPSCVPEMFSAVTEDHLKSQQEDHPISSLLWFLSPRAGICVDAPSSALSSAQQVITTLSPLVHAFSSTPLASSSPSSHASVSVSHRALDAKKEGKDDPIAASSTTSTIWTSEGSLTSGVEPVGPETKKKDEYAFTEKESSLKPSQQVRQQEEPASLTDAAAVSDGTEMGDFDSVIAQYFQNSFLNAFSFVLY